MIINSDNIGDISYYFDDGDDGDLEVDEDS